MNFQQAEDAYAQLANLLATRQITRQDFSNRVKDLVVRDESGLIWQIRDTVGAWMRWNGSMWEQLPAPHKIPIPSESPGGREPAQQPPDLQKRASKAEKTPAPKSLFELLKLILRQLLKRLPIMLLLAIISGLVVYGIQFYLMAFTNDGFRTSGRVLLDWVLLIRGRGLSGLILYSLLGLILGYLFSSLLRGRIFKLFAHFGKVPSWISEAFKKSGASGIPLLLGGGATALLIGSVLNNPLVSLQLAFLTTLEVIKNKESLLGIILHLGWSDLQRLFRSGQPPKHLSKSSAAVVTIGLALGFITAIPMSSYLPLSICGGVSALLLFGVAFAFFFNQRGKTVSTKFLMIILIALAGAAITASPVSADDGGWIEFGGSFTDWLLTIGALEIAARSLGGTLGTSFGTLTGNGISESESVIDFDDFWGSEDDAEDSGIDEGTDQEPEDGDIDPYDEDERERDIFDGGDEDDLEADDDDIAVESDHDARRDDIDSGPGREGGDQGSDDVHQGSRRDDPDQDPRRDDIEGGPGRDGHDPGPEAEDDDQGVDSEDDSGVGADQGPGRDQDESGVGADQGPGRDQDDSGVGADQGPGRDDDDSGVEADRGPGSDDDNDVGADQGPGRDDDDSGDEPGPGPDQDDDVGDLSVMDNFVNPPVLDGGMADNPFTVFDGGDGANLCDIPYGLPNYWVNTATLQLYMEDTIFTYQGLGPALRFTISYN
ncbi:MAG: hypothetical protein MUO76_17345, partial [Anaerolineaceae bacterium]|nr:hypothetical protein [Anaerolineaceae bacterium]